MKETGERLQRFRGRTVAEAMSRLKSALGQEAIIFKIEKGRRRFLGLFGPRTVEITAAGGAAADLAPPPRSARPSGAPAPTAAAPPRPARATALRLRRELEAIKHLAMDLVLQRKESFLDDLPGAWRAWYELLQEIGLSRERAQALVLRFAAEPFARQAPPEQVAAQVKASVLDRIPCAPPLAPGGGRERVALVGPPGVGKTTALMALATRAARERGAPPALLSLDNRCPGAAASLESCAQMLGLRFQAARTPEEVGPCLARLGEASWVLVDTAGRNPTHEPAMQELARQVAALGPARKVLVLAASDSLSFLRQALASYRRLEPSAVIFTKMDESGTPGILCELAEELPGGVAHLGTGQSLPGDLAPATRETLEVLLFEAGARAAPLPA